MSTARWQPRDNERAGLLQVAQEAHCASPSPAKLRTRLPYVTQRPRKTTRKNGSGSRLTKNDLQVSAAAAGPMYVFGPCLSLRIREYSCSIGPYLHKHDMAAICLRMTRTRESVSIRDDGMMVNQETTARSTAWRPPSARR